MLVYPWRAFLLIVRFLNAQNNHLVEYLIAKIADALLLNLQINLQERYFSL